jgi:chorismate dehydratase
VNSLRISIVQYLNTAPLVWGFTHGPLRGKHQLSFTVPSQCAEALRTGAADIAIIPAIEYQRIDNLVVLPGLCIASKKTVRSLLLVSKVPMQQVRRIALDRSSRSTQALVRILCKHHWQISPEFFEADPDLPVMLKQAEAALLIGDPALHLSVDAEPVATKGSDGVWQIPGRSAGLSSDEPLFIHDMVENWRALTGLPAVLAVWAARPNVITPEIVRDFQDSLVFGAQQMKEISVEAARTLRLPTDKIARYLTENIDYTFDEENRRGLQRYFDLAAQESLIGRAKPLLIANFDPSPEFAVRRD